MKPPGIFSTLSTVYGLELRLEWRNRARILAIFVFAVILSVLYHYSLEEVFFKSGRNLIGSSLTTLFFASMLLTGWGSDSQDTLTFKILFLSPLDPAAIYLARVLMRWQILALLLAMYLPINAILLTGSLPGLNILPQWAVLTTTASSLAALGTLFNSMITQRGRGLLLPLLFLPAAIPVLILSSGSLDQLTRSDSSQLLAIASMLAPGILYCSLGALLFSYLNDEGPFTA
ncbi:MAG: heme exporter protein CcmB [Leptospirales bacterium]|nr:heme exporter protein CcmB [Leptospirales bacterium]